MVRVSTAFVLSGCLCMAGLACTPAKTGSSSGSGGSASSGGTNSGGSSGSGGNGGSTSNGGSASSGGSAGSGGSSGGGGKGGSGGATTNGGTASSGGSSVSGGSSASGGSGGSGGSSGSSGNGGATASGGKGGSGGAASGSASGGSGGSGGSSGSGGSPGSGGTSGSGGSTTTASCTFTQSSSTSTKIATVGIVKWSTTLSGLTSAKIDFGLDTSYAMTAPVDKPGTGTLTTLLLGMKPSKTYHYRITAIAGGSTCTSPDYTIATGALANGLPKITATTNNKTALYGGFLITGQYLQTGGGSPSYILDADSEMVWAYSISKDVTGAAMDYAGTHMWINSANVPSGTASVHRVTMDGLTDEDLSSKFTGLNHQLTVLPDETVAFYAYNASNGCDDIKEYSPSGTVKTIVNSGTAQGGASACHVNNIQYSKDDDTLVFSDLDNQVVVKVKRSDGSTVWILNGSKATITGDTWKGSEHGLHILGVDHFMLFNNNSRSVAGGAGPAGGDGTGSIAMEFKLDLTAKKITKTWSFKDASGIRNDVMGDVQRLPNGNTIIAYSTQGVLQEVDSGSAVLQELTWPLGASFGYVQKRATLYGPPPR
jgi:Arylsulfotransferase (ASST)